MRNFRVWTLVLATIVSGQFVAGEKTQIFNITTDLCKGTTFRNIKGAVIQDDSHDGTDCILSFEAPSILQKFMLRFETLNLECSDHLYIFDGASHYGATKADLSCRSTINNTPIIYTKTTFVTMRYATGGWNEGQGVRFRVVITAHTTGGICSGFRCVNSLCISPSLRCDGVNHCGDRSDEDQCRQEKRTASTSPEEKASHLIIVLGLLWAISSHAK